MKTKKYLKISIVIIMLLFVFRLLFSISGTIDESFNAAVSYQLANGSRLLVNCWDSFQMGNSFSTVFIWVYVRTTGGTEGIILFLRILYLLINICAGFYLVYLLKPIISQEFRMVFVLFFITCAPFTYYYLYYDTALLLFMVLGLFSFVNAYKTNNKITAYLTGLFFGLMTYAYPTIVIYTVIIVVLASIILISAKKYTVLKLCWLGGLTLIAVFLGYCLCSGVNNLYFINSSVVGDTVESRGILSSIKNLGKYNEAIYQTVVMNFKQIVVYAILAPSILILHHFNKNWKIVLVVLILSPILFQNTNYLEVYGQFNFYLLLYMLVPVMYLLLDKGKRKQYSIWIWFVWLTCVISYFIISFTTAFASGKKGEMGLLPGALVFFILLDTLLVDETDNNMVSMNKCIPVLVLVVNILIFYMNTFWSKPLIESNYVMQTGIYKGIITVKENKFFEERETRFKSYNLDYEGTIAVGDEQLMDTYLYTSLKPHSYSLWVNLSSCISTDNSSFERYYDLYTLPTYLVFSPELNVECIAPNIKNVLQKNYDLIINDEIYTIYELNGE